MAEVFFKGIRVFPKNDKTPDFVISQGVITIEEIREFFNEQKQHVKEYNGKHQLRFKILRKKDGSGEYFTLDTYEKQQPPAAKQPEDLPKNDDLPF